MLKSCPNPIDVQDLQFKLHCRLKCFENNQLAVFPNPYSLVSCASRYGLIFVGTNTNTLQAIQTKSLNNYCPKDKDIINYPRREVSLPSNPKHLCVNCDNTVLAVVVNQDNCPWAIFYDVLSFFKQNLIIIDRVRLSASPNVCVQEINWNPSLPLVFTACKSDGSLGLYELKEKSVDISELPSDSCSTTFCWSPKGKQIAVGSKDGKITQYKPDLKAVKIINKPPLDGPYTLISLQWVSNYQFIGVYQSLLAEGSACVIVVDSPKVGECTYTHYDDICYSGASRDRQFYMILQPQWNILMMASANSTELGVLGATGEIWTQWIVPDSARAELPLSSDHQETLPVGISLDISSTQPLPWGESTIPPCPMITLLSHHGVLCLFNVVNLKPGVPSLCTPPDCVSDLSGLSQFVSPDSVSVSTSAASLPFVSSIQGNTLIAPKPTFTTVGQTSGLPLFGEQKPVVSIFQGQTTLTPIKPQQSQFKSNNGINLSSSGTGISQQYSSIFSALNTPSLQTDTSLTKVSTVEIPISSKPQPQQTSKAFPPSKCIESEQSDIVPVVDPKAEAEKDALLKQMIRDECTYLEAELKALLYQGRLIKVNLGTDPEKTEMVQNIDSLKTFLREIMDINTSQSAEVHFLKQNLVQSWAWYEEAKSRYHASNDEAISTLLRSQPLDSAAEKRLKDIQQMKYYIEAQLNQASKALDEQWDNFQDYAKKTHRIQTPTMEAIFQTMVRQTAILQKQTYVLKDIAMRVRKKTRFSNSALLVHLDKNQSIVDDLQNMSLNADDICNRQYDKILNRTKLFTSNKTNKLRNFLKNRNVVNITVTKPQLSLRTMNQTPANKTKHMISILGAQLSPVSKSAPAKNLDFVQSTPLRDFRPEGKSTHMIKPSLSQEKSVLSKSKERVTLVHPSTTGGGFVPLVKSGAAITSIQGSAFAPTTHTFSATKMYPTTTQSKAAVSFTPANVGADISKPVATTASFIFNPTFSSAVSKSYETPSTKSIFSFNNIPATTKSAFSFTGSLGGKSADKTPSFSIQPPNSSSVPGNAVSPSTFSFGSAAAANAQKATVFTPVSSTVTASQAVTTGSSQLFGSSKPTLVSDVIKTETSGISVKASSKVSTSTTSTYFGNWSQPVNLKRPDATPVPISGSTGSVKAEASQSSTESSLFKDNTGFTADAVRTESTTRIVETSKESVASAVFSGSLSSHPVSSKSSFFGNAGSSSIFGSTTTTQSSIFGNSGSVFRSSTSTSAATPVCFGSTTTISQPPVTVSSLSAPQPIVTVTSSVITTDSSKISGDPIITSTSDISGVVSSVATVPEISASIVTSSIFEPSNVPPSPAVTIPAAQPSVNADSSSTGTTGFGILLPSSNPETGTTQMPSIFGGANTASVSKPSIFGNADAPPVSQPPAYTQTSSSIFGTTPVSTQASLFGGTSSSVFGSNSSPQTSQSIFGGTTPISQTSAFGSATSTQAGAIFANNATTAATTLASPFGSTFGAQTSTASPFAKPPTSSIFAGTASNTGSIFGQPATFGGSSIFGGTPTTTAAASIFGKPAAFGSSSVFASTAASTPSVFGSPSTTSSFGSGFGAVTSTGSVFGSAATSQPSSFSFTNAVNNTATTGSFGLGGLSVNSGSSGGSIFGSTTSSFGQTPAQNPFGKTEPPKSPFASTPSNIFGSPASTTSSPFSTNTGSTFGGSTSGGGFTSSFGGASTFAQQKPAFGQSSIFGGSSFGSAQPGAFSAGGGAAVAQTGFGSPTGFQKPSGFGSPPTFGGTPAFGASPSFGGAPAFGAAAGFGSPGKVFGASSPTGITGGFGAAAATPVVNTGFENLANQNTIGFGNLAQQAAPPGAAPFSGASSFSSWR